ncbi:GTP 3',8-cyclase MoaA [Mucilaginibacter ginkgonis]|uniref:GTP 3',8-cyclase n=1 Tax=Mucilaginibacter ginkgonis TaxID=2682091 RepID=A0A6I4I6Y6_9SPHI|nr:GTP 3',8-cyclase MoaA [Mucilaginibacter ginkgonis]QQL50735.1 GTP 3',8-cyclase MoaA [Mucilaginibacter ginkgonis]
MNQSLLVDQYGRRLNYLRLSVTDRCNFRCYYCMPEEGINFAKRADLLSFDEMFRLAQVFCGLGVDKIRITGGEPFVRDGIIPFLYRLRTIENLKDITVTTNGTLTARHQSVLKELGITKLNISLDSLDATRFHQITRRDSFNGVFGAIMTMLEDGFDIKLNSVVAERKNVEDILPFVELTRNHNLAVRFLEEMPFNGSEHFAHDGWDHVKILEHIKMHYPELDGVESGPSSTSVNYKVPGYVGSFGIIPSFSRTFCGTCNRIRLSATGELRTCLYGAPNANLRDVLRNGASKEELENLLLGAVAKRAKDGFAAEKMIPHSFNTSMSVLGG